MSRERSLRVAVVGAGIVGVSTAEWLRRGGHEVTLLDRVPPGDPRQTSYGNAGLLTPSSIVPVTMPGLIRQLPWLLSSPRSPLFVRWQHFPRLAPLTADACSEHLALAGGTGAEQFVRTSDMACVYADHAAFESDREAFELRARHGHHPVILDRDALAELDPGLSTDYRCAALFSQHGYITDPGEYVAALASHFAASGGVVRIANVEQVSPRPEQGIEVVTDAGSMRVDRAVICAGIDSGFWMKTVGHRARLESERGYHIMLHGARPLPRVPLILADARAAVTPMKNGLRIAGLVEFAGRDAAPGRKPVEYLRRLVRRAYPNLRWDREETWMGNRPATIDSLPMLGASPRHPDLFFAFGTHHVGLTTGPRLGRWAAELVSGARPNVDLAPYRVDRFDPRRDRPART